MKHRVISNLIAIFKIPGTTERTFSTALVTKGKYILENCCLR